MIPIEGCCLTEQDCIRCHARFGGRHRRSGQGIRQGILAAFAEINAGGGAHGRKLHLVSRDDGYDPDRSVVQTTKLIEEDSIFALIGAVGTPTAIETVPISSEKRAEGRILQGRRPAVMERQGLEPVASAC
jgi:hypothetical protein